MSEPESNVCVVCGGMKRIEYTISFEECAPREVRVGPGDSLLTKGWRLCPGHPEPEQKQGDLTEVCQLYGNPLYVRLDERDPEKSKYELDQIRSVLRSALAPDALDRDERSRRAQDLLESGWLPPSRFLRRDASQDITKWTEVARQWNRHEEQWPRPEAEEKFADALRQCGLTFVTLADHEREQSGILGYVIAPEAQTPEQINRIQQFLEQALLTERARGKERIE